MSKDHDDKLNPEDLEFTLEEILAEYAVRENRESEARIPIPMKPAAPQSEARVLPFPGPAAPPAEPEKTPEPEGAPEEEPPEASSVHRPRRLLGAGGRRLLHREPEPEAQPEPESEPEPETEPEPPRQKGGRRLKERPAPREKAAGQEKVLPFPEEERSLAAGLRRLRERADGFAEHMFEDEGKEDSPEVRRAERYIPGVDEEEPQPPPPPRKKRRPPPPAPDLPPQELFRRYSRGLGVMKLRAALVLLLAGLILYLTLAPSFGAPLPGLLDGNRRLLLYCQAGLLALGMLLALDTVLWGIFRLITFRLAMDSLVVLACAAALADAFALMRLADPPQRQPYCGVAALALAFTILGNYLKRKGQRVACRTAASASEPYLVTLDEAAWNGRDAYAKWSGEPLGFGRQMQAPDGAERIFHIMAPLLLLACLLFSILASVGRRRPEDLLWCLSATLSASASFSATLCYGVPWNSLSARLAKSGAALAGWDGVTATSGRSGILLTDHDLFPPGTVSLNGIKIFGDFPVDKVVGVTATLIRDTGSGLDKIFHDLLRTQGATYRRSSDFCCYEGGGVSAVMRGELVLVGSASFMHLMEVPLPQGLNVKNAVFCAIDGELAGLFALKYTLHGTVEPALFALIQNHIAPVLATRDFNIIPAMLQQRFKLPADRMEFPAVERRVELSARERKHSDILTAVLCREGVGPFTEAAVGGKRLRSAVRTSAMLTCLGSCVGVVLAFYLTFMAAYDSLTPFNLLVFLLMWMVPTVLISHWVDRY